MALEEPLDVRENLFDAHSGADVMRRRTRTEDRDHGSATTITSSATLINVHIPQDTEVAVYSYKWFAQDEARLEVEANGTIVDADYLEAAGEEEHRGTGWDDPYDTIDNFANGAGSLVYRIVPEAATVSRAEVVSKKEHRPLIEDSEL